MKFIYPISLSMVLLSMAACAPQGDSFASPSGSSAMVHDKGDGERRPTYTVKSGGRELGTVSSIIDAATVENVQGLPTEHKVLWSPSERTALIYENMSDASPDYQHVLIRMNPEEKSFKAYKVDLGLRYPSVITVYPIWPDVSRITDEAVYLEWATEPKQEVLEIGKLIEEADTGISE